ncbi:hypothetical protein ACLB2K_075558 [Fragaria x ananassa]
MALSTQTGSAGSAFPWKYDVFLSFRGVDTRKGFTDYLYDKLQWRGIRTFRDDPHLERGTTISPELLTAIKQSRFAIVVLSPDYASSTWCLLELSKIFESMEERGTILPIFYEVEPSHVRHQRGSFAEAFEEHEEKFGEGNKEVERWRDALTKVANLAGWSSKDYRYETELIRDIVQELWSKVHLSLTTCESSEKLVGMDHKLEEMDILLDKEANDVRFIGIWGMGGLGKTTLARLVYEKISHQFEVSIFLADVREGLNEDEALQLFCWKAFRKYVPEEDYVELSKSFVMYARGLPLALKTLGSFLYQRSPDAWNSALAKLRSTPNKTIFDLLKLSYDELDEMEKKIFLDIACYSSQCRAKFIIELLYSSDVCNRIAIDVLVEKSLLTISSGNEIGIHDLIQEMGCEIVRQESYEEPGRRSRLWLRNDIFHVFTKNTGTEAIEGILLHLAELEEADWNLEAFSKMRKLKLLYLQNLKLSLVPKYLPNDLIFLNWSWYPSKSLPPAFQPDDLTELSLVHSNIDHLWNGIKFLSKLKSIDLSYSVNLTRTPNFTGTPNLGKLVLVGCTSLVKIHPSIALLKRLKIWNFRDCKSIKSLPSEVHMEFLETFDVSGCSKLKKIPEFVGQMKRLSLSLGGSAVEKLPSSIELLSESLVKLDLNGSVIREQPCSLFLKLQNLMVSSFGFFPRRSPHPLIPLLASLRHFSCLRELNLNDCNLCEGDIPNDISSLSSLKRLELRGNNFVSLPAGIHLLSKLRIINVEDCKRLQQLPELPVNHALHVRVNNCTSLQVFPEPSDKYFLLKGINCLSTVANQDASYFLYSALKRLLEETSSVSHFVIPGSEIPEWFKNNQTVGGSVIEKLPSDASKSKLIAFAVCALIQPQDGDDCIRYAWYNYSTGACLGGYCFEMYSSFSDHLMLGIWPKCRLKDTCNEVKFVFNTNSCVGNKYTNRKEMKQCGFRALYEHDMEEVISRMSQSKCNISLYEATDEQEGAMVKATTCRSGGSDDEYYSAEE